MSRRHGKQSHHAPSVARRSSPLPTATDRMAPVSTRAATVAVVTAIADAVGELLSSRPDETT